MMCHIIISIIAGNIPIQMLSLVTGDANTINYKRVQKQVTARHYIYYKEAFTRAYYDVSRRNVIGHNGNHNFDGMLSPNMESESFV